MKLILKESLLHFNGKHFLQTHSIAVGAKMTGAFSVIFIAHIRKQLLLSCPHKHIIWDTFIDDIFSVWTSIKQEISNFVDFANRFHATIKFTREMPSERTVVLGTEVFRGLRFASNKVLDVLTHFKATKMFQNTHFSSCHSLSVKKGFIEGETLLLLRMISIKERFKSNKRNFKSRLLGRGYPKSSLTKYKPIRKSNSHHEITLCNTNQRHPKTIYRSTLPTTQVYRTSKRSLRRTGL